jgi:hypothetical protein
MNPSRRSPLFRTIPCALALATFLFGSQYCIASLLLGSGTGARVMPCHGGPGASPCHGSSDSKAPAQDGHGAPCCIQLTVATESAAAAPAPEDLAFVLPSAPSLDASGTARASFASYVGESPPGSPPGPQRGRAPPLS